MAERLIIDQLDDAVSAMFDGSETDRAAIDVSLLELVDMAHQLRGLPREEFRKHLKDELIRSDTMSSPKMKVEPTQPTFSVSLCFSDAAGAIEFYKQAFGAEELMRLVEPSGKVGHAELKIGESVIMLSDEYPDYGALSPQTLGGSPVRMHLSVADVDTFVEKVVTLGASIVRPIEDQFYGDRSGQIVDPFGYTWNISTHQKDVPVEELQKQFDEFAKQAAKETTSSPSTSTYKRVGYHTVTPYLTVERPEELLDFIKQSFSATEVFRTTGSAGGMHAEAKIGDSMLMVVGGSGIEPRPSAIHLYIPDVDEAYQRAIAAGATSLFEPADMEYGERAGAVQDSTGNRWYIATTFGPLKEISEHLHTITQYLHPIGAQGMIDFLVNGLGGEELMRHASDDNQMIYHAKVRIGDSVIELGEARTEDQPMPSAIYLYVEDVDELYERALKAGGESVLPPTDQPYGDRNAWVKDPFNNIWYLATYLGA